MPAQKNWVASVAMKEGMPIVATRTPLRKPTRSPEASAGDDGDPAEVVLLEEHGEDEAREGDDRREAEVDLAGADDEGEADGEQDQRRQRREEGGVDEGLQEDLRCGVHEEGEEQREDEDDRQALDRATRRARCLAPCVTPACCRSMRYSVSSITDMSFGTTSATIRPRSSTISRSATSWTWARLCSM